MIGRTPDERRRYVLDEAERVSDEILALLDEIRVELDARAEPEPGEEQD